MHCSDINDLEELLQTLRQSKTIQHINLLVNGDSHVCQCEDGKKSIDDLTFINVDNPNASRTLLEVEANTDAEYVLLNLKATPVSLGQHALDRMLRVATDSGAGMVYADSYIGRTDREASHHRLSEGQHPRRLRLRTTHTHTLVASARLCRQTADGRIQVCRTIRLAPVHQPKSRDLPHQRISLHTNRNRPP